MPKRAAQGSSSETPSPQYSCPTLVGFICIYIYIYFDKHETKHTIDSAMYDDASRGQPHLLLLEFQNPFMWLILIFDSRLCKCICMQDILLTAFTLCKRHMFSCYLHLCYTVCCKKQLWRGSCQLSVVICFSWSDTQGITM